MDIIIGLGIFGYALLYSSNNIEVSDKKIFKDAKFNINDYHTHYLNSYTVDFLENNKSIYNPEN